MDFAVASSLSSSRGQAKLSGGWMSSSEIRALRAELEALRLSVEAVRESVQELRDRLDLASGAEGAGAREASEAGFPAPTLRAPSTSGYSCVSHSSSSTVQSTNLVAVADHEGRAALARDMGKFLVRCLEGSNRGSSGRARLKLPSRCYLILADYAGNRLAPRVVSANVAPAAGIASSWDLQQSGN